MINLSTYICECSKRCEIEKNLNTKASTNAEENYMGSTFPVPF